MKIGQLAQRTGCTVETIRYYEQAGLLPAPSRSDGNYRIYTEQHAERLTFIRNCRALDMTQDEIRELLRIKDENGRDCGDIDILLDEHIGHVSRRIEELSALQAQLQSLRDSCGQHLPVRDCGILRGLTDPLPEVEPNAGGHGAHRHGVHGKWLG